MTGQEKIQRGYRVSVRKADTPDSFHVSYAPRGLQQARGAVTAPKRVPPDFKALVLGLFEFDQVGAPQKGSLDLPDGARKFGGLLLLEFHQAPLGFFEEG